MTATLQQWVVTVRYMIVDCGKEGQNALGSLGHLVGGNVKVAIWV
jgi:hypothetical protein